MGDTAKMAEATFSTLIWMIQHDIALGHCAQWTEEQIKDSGREMDINGDKREEEIARVLVNGCSQYRVTERLAEEWGLLRPVIRMRFTDIANAGRRSGNVDKGLLHLDKLLGGKILRHNYVENERFLKERDGKTLVASRTARDRSREEIAWKFVALPADFQKWPPGRKRRFQQQLARERREARE